MKSESKESNSSSNVSNNNSSNSRKDRSLAMVVEKYYRKELINSQEIRVNTSNSSSKEIVRKREEIIEITR
jgi:hypothetical protein